MIPMPAYVENVSKVSYPTFEAVLDIRETVCSPYDDIIPPIQTFILLDQVRKLATQEYLRADIVLPSKATRYQTERTIRTLPAHLLNAVDRYEALHNPHGTISLVFEKGEQWGEIEIGKSDVSVIAFRGGTCVLKSVTWNPQVATDFMEMILTGDGTIPTI